MNNNNIFNSICRMRLNYNGWINDFEKKYGKGSYEQSHDYISASKNSKLAAHYQTKGWSEIHGEKLDDREWRLRSWCYEQKLTNNSLR